MSLLRLLIVFEPLEHSHVSVLIVFEPLELSHVSFKIVECI